MSEDDKKIVWNVTRACFWLLASIIWAQIILGYGIFGSCVIGIFDGKIPVGSCKELVPNVMELLVGGLAVVIAFARPAN